MFIQSNRHEKDKFFGDNNVPTALHCGISFSASVGGNADSFT